MTLGLEQFDNSQKELACQLALLRTPGVGPVTFHAITTHYSALFTLFESPQCAEGVSPKIRQALSSPDWEQVASDLDWLNQPNRFVIPITDDRYPTLLKHIADPPPLLFVQGDIALLNDWQLAIVGSRNPSSSGRESAYAFAEYLASGDLIITSGLAMGIDAAAHQGALAGGGKTIAVVGTGLDRVYPAKHRDLAHQIVEKGALVSEFPLGTPPKAENFPRRNRIISGLSLGTMVVEAAIRSGSLITARMAMEQGREVFAMPGSIHNPLARGCHRLIREGAKLVESAEDIIEELGALAGVKPMQNDIKSTDKPTNLPKKDPEYQLLFEKMGFDPIHIDALISRSGLTADVVSSMLLMLELQGQVASLPGGQYIRCRA